MSRKLSRREVIAGLAGAAGAAAMKGVPGVAGQEVATSPAKPAPDRTRVPADPTKVPGRPPSELGERSQFERPRRLVLSPGVSGDSATPLQDLEGIITPADLHYERHHGGVPEIDPERYSLLIHGMVARPTLFSLADLKRFPSVSVLRFMECSGNGYAGYMPDGIRPDLTPQQVDGLTSTSEWTGVPLATLFKEVGADPRATWFLAEGSDAAVMTRSIPVAKGWDDALIAYGQNGEAIRPEQGYPARLLLPGWEGNTSVKWLRRLELSDRPFETREETSKYTDVMPDGRVRQFSLIMDAKSIITFPAYPRRITPGWWEITGIAWSGHGRIERVEVSTNGGATWSAARLQEPVLPKCHTRFRHGWEWHGEPALLMSRATDETGNTQPTLEALRRERGTVTVYHNNNIRAWRVQPDGRVVFGLKP